MPAAQTAMARPLIHHRTPEFREIFLAARDNLRKIFQTRQDLVILACSGTGAMDAAVVNLLAPGETALAVVAGKFGERWTEICDAHGVRCIPLCKEYGEAAEADEICARLRESPQVRALLIQGCETSTGTSHDLERISARVGEEFPQVLIVVDAITALGSQPLLVEQWGLDLVIGGSQKAFGMSPGLAFLSVGKRALERMRTRSSVPSYYFNLVKEAEKQRVGTTAFTAPVSLVEALKAVTDEMLAQGLDNVIREAETMARCTRAGLWALGFRLLSKSPSNAVTAAFPPDGLPAPELIGMLDERFGLKVAGGQNQLKGKIIRIAHLGYFDLLDVVAVLSAIELCLRARGLAVGAAGALKAALDELESPIPEPSRA